MLGAVRDRLDILLYIARSRLCSLMSELPVDQAAISLPEHTEGSRDCNDYRDEGLLQRACRLKDRLNRGKQYIAVHTWCKEGKNDLIRQLTVELELGDCVWDLQ